MVKSRESALINSVWATFHREKKFWWICQNLLAVEKNRVCFSEAAIRG